MPARSKAGPSRQLTSPEDEGDGDYLDGTDFSLGSIFAKPEV
jgi:hypothetical protein